MVTAKRCTAMRLDGLPCAAFAKVGGDLCASHDPTTVYAEHTFAYPPCETCGRRHTPWSMRRRAEAGLTGCPNPPRKQRTVAEIEQIIARLTVELEQARAR